jgi:hypothetical protein
MERAPVVDAGHLRCRQLGFDQIVLSQTRSRLKIWTDVSDPKPVWQRKDIASKGPTPANGVKTLPSVRKAKVMRRDKAMAPALDMLSGYDGVTDALEFCLRHSPRTTTVMLLEVSDVLKDYVLGLVLLQDRDDVVEQSPTSVKAPILES